VQHYLNIWKDNRVVTTIAFKSDERYNAVAHYNVDYEDVVEQQTTEPGEQLLLPFKNAAGYPVTARLLKSEDQPMPEQTLTRRQARRAGQVDGVIRAWLLKDHPVLKQLFEQFAPLLMQLLMTKLPALLAALDEIEREDKTEEA